ncbi:MAG TPA: TIGR03668 family PPOX class F420-dependent oxidoreductase [Acidimicrobiia bacterium]|jgi:PPOX class probable F420-dependent enzyme|nr:TIGR03668 family PPOX class F420-dependent oxidoreductase [Acidimicrobiia bacterium]
MDDVTIRARVTAADVGRLATVTTDGRPHVVPCCFALSADTIYSAVDHKPKSTRLLRRIANLRANPNATLLVDHYADDWSTLWWVRADGTGRILDAGADLANAIGLLVEKYTQYRDEPPAGPVIAIDVTTWRAWP